MHVAAGLGRKLVEVQVGDAPRQHLPGHTGDVDGGTGNRDRHGGAVFVGDIEYYLGATGATHFALEFGNRSGTHIDAIDFGYPVTRQNPGSGCW